jgi:hypothetical protein
MAIMSLFDLLAPQAVTPSAAPAVGGTWALNPRPDLAEDADLWRRLLAAAALSDRPGVYGALHGVRCCGARLVANGAGYRITGPAPDDGPLSYREPDPETGEIGTWESDREGWLLPHRAAITVLLRSLTAEVVE